MKLEPKDYGMLSKVALGDAKADFVLTNGKVVNVFTGECLPGDVYIYDGFIAHVEYEEVGKLSDAKEVIDVKGQYIIPGLIDSHIHIESTMMTPIHFAKAVLPHGSTTVVTDPHEVGNVFGVEGVKYMIRQADGLPMRQLINIPSCVPSLPGKEFTGADFTSKEIEELANEPRVSGLAEVMDFFAVMYGEKRMRDILDVARKHNLYLQGHIGNLSSRMYSAYLCGGPNTNHEASTADEALRQYRLGMTIDMRESSLAKNVSELWKGLGKSRYFDTLCLCTDDREPEDILREGEMDHVIRRAIEEGMDPIDAIKSATINNAREMKMEHLGAIAPGYVADICVVKSLEKLEMDQVYFEGKKVVDEGKLCIEIEEKEDPIETRNSMNLPELSVERFQLRTKKEGMVKVHVMKMLSDEMVLSELEEVELPVVDGVVQLGDDPTLKYIAVVNRFGLDHVALGVVRNAGNECGTLGSTISHDSHNLTIVYDDPEDALLACKELESCGGGLITIKNHEVLGILPLPVAGLLSTKSVEELAEDCLKMKEIQRDELKMKMENPLVRIFTFALPVVPNVRMTDMGLIDVFSKEYIKVIQDE